MGTFVLPSNIYTNAHCLYPSNIFNTKKEVFVIDPKSNQTLGTFQFQDIKINSLKKVSYLSYILSSFKFTGYINAQHDFIDMEISELNNLSSIIKKRGVSTTTKISRALLFTALITCNPQLYNKLKIRTRLDYLCRASPTKTVVFGYPKNGGWYEVRQDKNYFDLLESPVNGVRPSFNIADSNSIYGKISLSEDTPKIPERHKFNKTIFGVFENQAESFYAYRYESPNATAFKHLTTMTPAQSLPGDSGGAVVACDMSGLLGSVGKCYFIGIHEGFEQIYFPYSKTEIYKVELHYNFVDRL